MEVAPSGRPAGVAPREPQPAPSVSADTAPPANETPARPAPAEHAPGLPSSLKFTISAADVDATFAIHEELRRVMVTMTDSTSGEVLRQIPPKEILDAIVALRGNGLLVDVAS